MTSLPLGRTLAGNLPCLFKATSCPGLRVRDALIPSTLSAFLAKSAVLTAVSAASPSDVQPSTATIKAAAPRATGRCLPINLMLDG